MACSHRLYGFGQLPDHLVLRIFRDLEYVPKSISEQQAETGGSLYEHVTDDTLTVLIDGYQKRCGLPQICKRWSKLLSQPSFVWAYLNIGFHELWNVQQVTLCSLKHCCTLGMCTCYVAFYVLITDQLSSYLLLASLKVIFGTLMRPHCNAAAT